MNQEYFEKWNDFAKNVQVPFQEVAELNAKTLQGFSYLKPDELADIRKPEELVAKNVAIAIENGNKVLAYMQESFQIFEKTAKSTLENAEKATKATKKAK